MTLNKDLEKINKRGATTIRDKRVQSYTLFCVLLLCTLENLLIKRRFGFVRNQRILGEISWRCLPPCWAAAWTLTSASCFNNRLWEECTLSCVGCWLATQLSNRCKGWRLTKRSLPTWRRFHWDFSFIPCFRQLTFSSTRWWCFLIPEGLAARPQ